MTKINIGKLSDYLMNIGIVLSLLSLYLIYRTQKNLPQGVCAIDNNNEFIIISICTLMAGLILSFFYNEKYN